jgi:hypothetical protein
MMRVRPLLAIAIVLWVVATFWEVAALRAVNIQDDIFTSDLLNDRLPARAFVGASLRRGELPLWSSEIYTGFPIFAQPEVGSLYPSNAALFGLLPPYVAVAYAQLLPLVLVGIGTGFLALEYGLPPAAALLAGGSMALSGFFVCHIRQLNLIDAACWLPFLLLVVERAVRGNRRVVAALACVWVLSLFAGHPQVSYFTALVVGVYAICRMRQVDRPAGKRFLPWLATAPVDPRLWRLAAGVAIGTLLAAVQLAPTLELASLGLREGGIPYEMAAAYPVSPKSFWSFFFPYVNGDISNSTFMLSGIFWEQYGYLGLLPLLLAIFGLVVERRDPRVRLLFGIAVVSWLMMLGPNTELFPLAFYFVPGMSYFRFPARFLLFVELAIALLAAFGLAHLLRMTLSRAVGFAIASVAVLATAGDLWMHQRRQVPLVDWETWTKPIETAEILGDLAARTPLAPPRYLALDVKSLHIDVFHHSRGWAGDRSHFVALRDFLQPSFNLLFGIASADGYANLPPSYYETTFGSEKAPGLVAPSGSPRPPVWETKPHLQRVLELFDVRYVLSAWPLASDAFRRIAGTKEGVQIYELPTVLPRAFVVGRARHVANDEEAVRILREGNLEIADEALVHTDPLTLPDDAGSSANVAITARSSTSLSLRSETERPGLLLVSEAYYPGWRAWIDEREVPVHRANLMMRAVVLPAGGHEILFEFHPASVRVGAALSLLGLVLLVTTVALERRGRLEG